MKIKIKGYPEIYEGKWQARDYTTGDNGEIIKNKPQRIFNVSTQDLVIDVPDEMIEVINEN